MPSPARASDGPGGGVCAVVSVAIARDDLGFLVASCL